MPRTTKFSLVLSDYNKAIIARALYEAANRRDDPLDLANRFRDDPDVAREMRAVLEALFPDSARAFADADALRDALSKGYLPPPGGATPESVKLFSMQRETAQDFRRVANLPPRKPWHEDIIDSDLPF